MDIKFLKPPLCAVLLATYNGEQWLPEQLDSICSQQDVSLRIIASDDQSSDSTLVLLRDRASLIDLHILPQQVDRFGSANRNFLRLIRDSDIGDAEFVSLADQDDIWFPEKLKRAIVRMQNEGTAAYSSDVQAFWPNGRVQLIKKSHSQKKYDYLFGSPGPGCTFVFTREMFMDIRSWVTANFVVLSHLWVHDWTLYAFARASGYRWLIDGWPSMLYRQHQSNEIGANFGINAIRRRFAIVKQGRYRQEIIDIAELIGANPELVTALRRLEWSDRLWLIRHAGKFRRSLPEVLVLCVIFILMPSVPIASAR